jgi:predicted lipoprotein with Yx(FWY)xxD motif
MLRQRVVQASVVAAALLSVAACGGGNSSDSSSKAKASSSSSPSSAGSSSSSPSPAAAAGAAQIKVATTSAGSVLTDDKGRVLYMFNPDNRGASVCYAECATAWPPTLTTGKPTAGPGADASLLGTTTRKDGKTQVTYNKYPLYTFAFDPKPGDTNGVAVKSIWWVLNPAGVPQDAPAKVSVAAAPSLGKVLVDVKGETLYMFTKDKNGKSACTGSCLKFWVPVHTFGAPTAGSGAQAGLLGTTPFAPGVTQVTYKGHPLYFFGGDQAPGDIKGQGFKGLWYAVDPTGSAVTKKS